MHCPKCGTKIPFYRNVPVFAYVFQRGRSHCCQNKISFQYPLVELLTALLSLATILHVTSITEYFAWFCLFICPLIVISIIDMKLRIIPDVISLPLIVVGVFVQQLMVYPNFVDGLITSGIGILAGGGTLLLLSEVISRLKKQEALGGGDIKLAAAFGAFFGWLPLVFIFFASSVCALIYFVLRMITIRSNDDPYISFGPFLAMGAIVYFLYGEVLTNYYFFELAGLATNPFFPTP